MGTASRGEEAAKALTNFLNGASREEKKEFVEYLTRREHRTLQQSAFGLFLDAVFAWAKGEHDLRNQYTVETSKKIAELVEYPGAPFI